MSTCKFKTLWVFFRFFFTSTILLHFKQKYFIGSFFHYDHLYTMYVECNSVNIYMYSYQLGYAQHLMENTHNWMRPFQGLSTTFNVRKNATKCVIAFLFKLPVNKHRSILQNVWNARTCSLLSCLFVQVCLHGDTPTKHPHKNITSNLSFYFCEALYRSIKEI